MEEDPHPEKERILEDVIPDTKYYMQSEENSSLPEARAFPSQHRVQ
jgi:hypothetical protein